METWEQREPQGTPEDLEQGTPQDKLVGEDPGPDQEEGTEAQGEVGSAEEGGADSPADAEREGG
jgi:hypothetical protein